MFSWLITCVNTLTELGHFCSNICDLETRDSGRLSKCVNHSDRVIFGTFYTLKSDLADKTLKFRSNYFFFHLASKRARSSRR